MRLDLVDQRAIVFDIAGERLDIVQRLDQGEGLREFSSGDGLNGMERTAQRRFQFGITRVGCNHDLIAGASSALASATILAKWAKVTASATRRMTGLFRACITLTRKKAKP